MKRFVSFSKRSRVVAMLIALALIAAVEFTLLAQQLESLEISKMRDYGAKGYVSDEVWYVDSARNILEKVFGLLPRFEGSPRATIVYPNASMMDRAVEEAPRYGVKVLFYKLPSGRYFFEKIPAIYVEARSIEDIERFAHATNATDIVFGWVLGDAENIDTYLNTEHPPMAKYLIALVMATLGDRPLYWRIPSICAGVALVVLTFLLIYEATRSELLALLTSVLLLVDPMVRNLASIAMLDIFVATFSVLAVYLALRRRIVAAVLAVCMGATFKFSALFAAIPVAALFLHQLVSQGVRRVSDVFEKLIAFVLFVASTFLTIQVAVSIPLINYLGFGTWFEQSITGAVSWHLSTKCVGPGCPPASTPLDWFFNLNTFPLYVGELNLAASGLEPVYALAFVLMLISIPSMALDKPRSRILWYALLGIFLGYVAIWFAGSRTQYSFYAVQLAPFIHGFVVVRGYELLRRSVLWRTLVEWYRLFAMCWETLLKFFE